MSSVGDLPYEKRRLLVVTSDIRQRTRTEKGADVGEGVGWIAGIGAIAVLTGWAAVPLLIVSAPFIWLGSKLARAVGSTIGSVADAKAGNIPSLKNAPEGLVLLLPEVAKREFQFPVGHPVEGGIYAAHPLSARRYFTVDGFHASLFQEKADGLLRLLASLGATTVKIHAKRGYRSERELHADVASGKERAGGEAMVARRGAADSRWEEHFQGTRSPSVPEGLVWLDREPGWLELAARRMDFGTSRSRTTLLYENSYNVDLNLKAKLEGLGLSVGGSLLNFEATEWDLDVEFAPR